MWKFPNAFFKYDDQTVKVVGGMELLPSWWSRAYEYAWAMQFTGPDLIVADMGAGWSGRPFKEHLATSCREVYAIDMDERFLELHNAFHNLHFVVANFEEKVPIPQVDRIFCISVLEDLTNYDKALAEFYRLLKPGGLVVATCDSIFDEGKPLPKYPGVSFDKLFASIDQAGFQLLSPCDFDKENAVHHDEWNLACWHMVLQK
jgi:ubiquinone/menaquinone biosynthesis C-methylase UbiE